MPLDADVCSLTEQFDVPVTIFNHIQWLLGWNLGRDIGFPGGVLLSLSKKMSGE
jgi:hypothetical protein